MSSPIQAAPHWRARFWVGLAVFTLLVMETTITSLWYQSIFARVRPAWVVIFGVLFVIFGASYMLPRALEALGWKSIARQAAVFAWILLAGYASLKLLVFAGERLSLGSLIRLPVLFILRSDANPVGFFHLLGIILLVWRGVSLARYPISLSVVQASFQLGLMSVLLYGMFFAPLFPFEAVVGLYLYLFCGLTAMSLSRVANLSENRGGRVPRFGWGWLVSILLAGLAVVGLAIVAGWVSSGAVVEWVARAFLVIIGILTALVLLILSPLFVWIARLLPMLSDLINRLLERLRNIPFIEQAAQLLEQISEGLTRLMPLVRAGRGLLLAGILLALAFGAMLALYLRRLRNDLIEEEASQTAETGPNDLSLQKLLQRMLRDARGLRLRRAAQVLAAARIRQIYRQLMLLSQSLGTARPASVTPLEFLPRLQTLFPDEQGGLERITGAYVSVRYGDYPESAAEVEEIQAAWERVRKQGRQMLAARPRANRRHGPEA